MSSQGQWSLIKRDLESDVLPMIRAEGMALGRSIERPPLTNSSMGGRWPGKIQIRCRVRK